MLVLLHVSLCLTLLTLVACDTRRYAHKHIPLKLYDRDGNLLSLKSDNGRSLKTFKTVKLEGKGSRSDWYGESDSTEDLDLEVYDKKFMYDEEHENGDDEDDDDDDDEEDLTFRRFDSDGNVVPEYLNRAEPLSSDDLPVAVSPDSSFREANVQYVQPSEVAESAPAGMWENLVNIPVKLIEKIHERCSCSKSHSCGCCVFIHFFDRFQDKKACCNITGQHDPTAVEKHKLNYDFNIDGKSLLECSLSDKTPPYVCVKLIRGLIKACVKMTTPPPDGKNEKCVCFEASLFIFSETVPAIRFKFRCICISNINSNMYIGNSR